MTIQGLNQEAWERWVAYRKLIRKTIKDEGPAQAKLMRFGDATVQLAVVDQSIENGWQGLFPLPQEKNDPHGPKTRTPAQKAAAQASFDYANRESQKEWDRTPESPIKRLKLCEALLARYDIEPDQSSPILSEKRSWLKNRVAGLLREANPIEVLQHYHLKRLVLRLFNDAGLLRLEQRAKEQEQVAA